MDSLETTQTLLSKATEHFNDALPFFPMYTHLLLSALFPIYAGAHASLSRPSSAAKPEGKQNKDTEDEDDEDEEKIQKMEGMSNTDAIVLPVTAAIVLAGLYFLIMRYGADLINLVLGWYFSAVGVYSVSQLVNDSLNLALGFVFPNYFASQGSLWKVVSSERKAVRQDSNSQTKDVPLPSFLSSVPLPTVLKRSLWTLRQFTKQKYSLRAYVEVLFEFRANITIVNAASAAFGLGTIIYVNTVSKPWFLTNLQGFAVSYSALQIMSPTTFTTGSLILSALFCYDIWAVFFTPLMVTVAKNLDQPIKLVFPRPDEPSATPGAPPVRSYSMLGLGDIVLPGIMIGLALRFDLWLYYLRKQTKAQKVVVNADGEKETTEIVEKAPYASPTGRWGDRFWTSSLPASALPAQLRSSFPKPYFTASVIGYVLGMIATLGVMSVFQHAQPALLYLVPGVLASLWGTSLVRGELKEMWEFSEAVTGDQLEEDRDSKDDVAAEKDAATGIFDRLWREIWGTSEQPEAEAKGTADEKRTSDQSAEAEKKKDSEKSRQDEAPADDVVFHLSLCRYDPNRASTRKAAIRTESDGVSEEGERETVSGSTSAVDTEAHTTPHTDGNVAKRHQRGSTRSTVKERSG